MTKTTEQVTDFCGTVLPDGYSLVKTFNTNPAYKPGNPYQRFPERASWVEGRIVRRPDGSLISVERDLHRWGATFSEGDWRIMEV